MAGVKVGRVGNAPQLSLDGDEEPSKQRVHIVATIFAGFRYPGVSFERLTQPQKRHVITVARDALIRLNKEDE
jgi:hypothetical protein